MKRTMTASEVNRNCLSVMADVATTGRSVIVTKRGRPLVEIVSCRKEKPRRRLEGLFKDDMVIKGEIISPIEGDRSSEANASARKT